MDRKILVVTPDVVAEKMAGPAIRAWNICNELCRSGQNFEVTLVSTDTCTIRDQPFDCLFVSWERLVEFAQSYDILIIQGFVSYHAPGLLAGDQIIVIDLYDPIQLEQLEQLRDLEPEMRRTTIDLTVRLFNSQIARGDFFLCANEPQRSFWLGVLAAMGRINPIVYDSCPDLTDLIAICPFGVTDDAPVHKHAVARGVTDGISGDDKLVLWAGGVYNWFDPLTLVRAIAKLSVTRPDVRLLFMGMGHPSASSETMSMAQKTRDLADDLGLTDKYVFFNEGWVAHSERSSYLLEADVGVSTHPVHVETRFSFRTRILDYLWAGLPIVVTEGDGFAELIGRERAGVSVPAHDVDALADALEECLYDRRASLEYSSNSRRLAEEFRWSRTLAPVVAFCASPRRAPDAGIDQRRIIRQAVPPANPFSRAVMRMREVGSEGGISSIFRRSARRIIGRSASSHVS